MANATTSTLAEGAQVGMALAVHAREQPESEAVVSPWGARTFAELNANANRLARLLRARGLGAGDAVAVVLKNRPEFVEGYMAAWRTGMRITPINWHLDTEQIAYIVDNCEARALLYDATLDAGASVLAGAPRVEVPLAVGGVVDGFEDYASRIQTQPGDDLDDPMLGNQMLYTSGTTGRPKGVYRRQLPASRLARATEAAAWKAGEDRVLCTGPAYHAAPLAFNVVAPLHSGVGVVFMDGFDAESALALIERYRVTHTHMVATMFHRLLQLPAAVREQYDLTSLRFVLHGAAPCPVHVKRAMIDWLGPILYEYYAATEGGGNYFITSDEWLEKPGSVGRSPTPELTRVLDDDGRELSDGEVGYLYFKAPEEGRFEYFKAPEKTADAYAGEFFTLGDMGYRDADGYLFLTGRSAETIISGGVNIYPQEIDAVLLAHPGVQDVCVIGAPSEEWGESVRAVVQPAADYRRDEALVEALMVFARERLPGFKCPRGIDFVDDLPRLPTGKIQRRAVRAPYWEGRDKQI